MSLPSSGLQPVRSQSTLLPCLPSLPAAHHVVTASHDSTAKLWDLRAAIPLHTLQGGTDKLLCAAWVGPETVATGGADCKLRTAHAAVSGIGGR